jgi:hypothetical protein
MADLTWSPMSATQQANVKHSYEKTSSAITNIIQALPKVDRQLVDLLRMDVDTKNFHALVVRHVKECPITWDTFNAIKLKKGVDTDAGQNWLRQLYAIMNLDPPK